MHLVTKMSHVPEMLKSYKSVCIDYAIMHKLCTILSMPKVPFHNLNWFISVIMLELDMNIISCIVCDIY